MSSLFDNKLPALAYNGSSGHSGTDTSKERAEHLDKSGKTKNLQQQTLALLAKLTFIGITWRELAEELKIHHGSASAVLTNLHKAGLIERLEMRRGRSKIYVLPNWVEYRLTEPPSAKKKHECPNCGTEF